MSFLVFHLGIIFFIFFRCRFSSEIYEVWDCDFYDEATLSNHNDNWLQWSNYPSVVTRGTEDTTITKSSENTIGYHIMNFGSYTVSAIEFDIYVDSTVNNNIIFQLRTSGRGVARQISLSNFILTANQWVHFKLDFDNDIISNNINSNTVVLNKQEATAFYFAVQTNQNSSKYKNFKVY